MNLKSILITGANIGIGKESARQLALLGVEKIYLGCRNLEKAEAAKQELEQVTGKTVFEILQLDLADLGSVRQAVSNLKEPVEALLMNAGGTGGKEFLRKDSNGVTQSFNTNVLGHVVLAEALLKLGKLTKVAVFAGTEVIRGVPQMGIKQFKLESSSVDEFASVVNGSIFKGVKDPLIPYGPIKYMGVLWMSSLARQYPKVRLVSMSPGGTLGTDGMSTLPVLKKVMFTVMMRVMVTFGRMHNVDVGAKRFVDALTDDSFESGKFYGSKKGVAGSIIEQSSIFSDLANEEIQNNAKQAIHQFIH